MRVEEANKIEANANGKNTENKREMMATNGKGGQSQNAKGENT